MSKKNELIYPDTESLRNVILTLNDAAIMLKGQKWDINDGHLKETVYGTVGGAAGAGVTLGAVSVFGATSGLSAAGISSGLAAIGGSMLAGIAIFPVAILAGIGAGVGIARHKRKTALNELKLKLYFDAKDKLDAFAAMDERVIESSDKARDTLALVSNIGRNLESDLRLEKIEFVRAEDK